MLFASEITFPGIGLELNPSPVAFTIFGKEIYWYAIIIACGMLAAYFLMSRLSESFGLNDDTVIDLLLSAIPIGIVGARAYYCIFYWELFRDNPISVFYIWQGGLAIYGGVIAGVLGIFLYCRLAKKPFLVGLDLAGFGVILGQVFGRWGNFFNREAHGGETDLPWRMGLMENGTVRYFHPTFLYESLWNLVGLFLLLKLRKKRKYDGEIFAAYLLWYGLGRFWIEGLRTDSLYLFSSGIRVSQLLAGVCVIAAGAFLLYNRSKEHKPEEMYVNRIAAAKTTETAAAPTEIEATAGENTAVSEPADTQASEEAAPETAAAEQPAETFPETEQPE